MEPRSPRKLAGLRAPHSKHFLQLAQQSRTRGVMVPLLQVGKVRLRGSVPAQDPDSDLRGSKIHALPSVRTPSFAQRLRGRVVRLRRALGWLHSAVSPGSRAMPGA